MTSNTETPVTNTDNVIDNKIGYGEFGSPTGTPVIYLHGLPGSRYEAALWHTTAIAKDIRLIAPDRPGMGLSPSEPDRKIIDYPKDVAQVIQHLQLESYHIIGISGGGPYALACAAQAESLFPGLRGVGIVAGLAPRHLMDENLGWYKKVSYAAMDWIPTSLVLWFCDTMVASKAKNPDPETLVETIRNGYKTLKGIDADLHKDDELMKNVAGSTRAAFASGSGGYVTDTTILTKPWGFDIGAAKAVKVAMWYGDKDDITPLAAGKGVADMVHGSKLTVLEGETHSGCVVRHQDEIFTALLSL